METMGPCLKMPVNYLASSEVLVKEMRDDSGSGPAVQSILIRLWEGGLRGQLKDGFLVLDLGVLSMLPAFELVDFVKPSPSKGCRDLLLSV